MTKGGEEAGPGLTEQLSQHERAFVGRWAERRWIATWLANGQAPSKVIAVTGHAGCGKSTLLSYAVRWLRSDVETLWLDARVVPPDPQVIQQTLGAQFIERLAGQGSNGAKIFLAIDNYESWDRADVWFREILLDNLPEFNVLIMMASRGYALEGWRLDSAWTGIFEEFALGPFVREEIEELLRRRQIIDLGWEAVYEMTAGNPLAVAMLADLWIRTPANLRDGVTVLVADRFSERVFQELNAGVDADLMQVLCLLSEVTLNTFEVLLQRAVSPKEFHHLAQLSCVRRTSSGGLALHDTLTPLLREDFRARVPETYMTLRQRALTYVMEQWDSASADKRMRLARDLLWLLNDRFEQTTRYANLSLADGDLYTTQAQVRDEAAIHQLLEQWGRQSLPLPIQDSRRLVSEVLRSFPEACYVTRNRVGQPVAFHGALWVCQDTLALLDNYCQRFVQQLLDGPWGLRRSARSEANTLVSVAVGMWIRESPYFVPQLTGALIRHSLASHFDARMMLLVQNDALKAFLQNLGFAATPFPLIASDGSEEMYVLDVRGSRFIQWVAEMTGDPGLSRDHTWTADEVGEALRALWYPARLSQTTLGRQMIDAQGMLLRGIDALRADPAHEPFGTLLYQAYVKKTHERLITETWHISRATYYRRIKDAVARLTVWLRTVGADQ
ncbi:MAG: hypothetical protein OWU33_12560 [Firmicutes bacterium]|nr:hypothetical protein [Bacillota bacterium]